MNKIRPIKTPCDEIITRRFDATVSHLVLHVRFGVSFGFRLTLVRRFRHVFRVEDLLIHGISGMQVRPFMRAVGKKQQAEREEAHHACKGPALRVRIVFAAHVQTPRGKRVRSNRRQVIAPTIGGHAESKRASHDSEAPVASVFTLRRLGRCRWPDRPSVPAR